MDVKYFMKCLQEFHPNLPPSYILKNVDFVHNGKEGWEESDDINAEFRNNVVKILLENKKVQNRAVVRYLLRAEIDYCREETLMTETLRMLTFMLYRFEEIDDIPILFEAKMDTSFDASCGLDIELIFGKDKDKVKEYYQLNEHENYDIVGCIEEYEKYDFQTPEEFIKGMSHYYGK